MSVLKFRNQPTEVDGVKFASKKEARRHGELVLLQRAGRINTLTVQPKFRMEIEGVHVCDYIADFSYYEAGRYVVEDVKSPATRKHPVYRLKNKLFRALYGFPITEV